ncbi:hypothetical protein [Azospirillum oleiclasticum]|nr:hypothetical protein [Azospirillum oleiclasticum]
MRSSLASPEYHVGIAGVRVRATMAAVGMLLISFALSLQFFYKIGEIDPFVVMSWTWDYSLGFVRRGLPGELLDLLAGGAGNEYRNLVVLSSAMLAVLVLAYGLFVTSILRHRPSALVLIVALAGALLEPAIPIFIRMFGRPEQLSFLLFLLACHAAVACDRRLACAVLAAACSLAMFIHEGFLFFHFPTALGVLAMRLDADGGSPHPIRRFAVPLAAAVPILCFAAVEWLGSPSVPKPVWDAHWLFRTPYALHESGNSLAVHHRGLAGNIRYTLGNFWPLAAVLSVLIIGAATVLARTLWSAIGRIAVPRAAALCFGSCYTPLLMFGIGVDYIRWSSFTALNMLVASLCLLRLSPVPVLESALTRICEHGLPRHALNGLAFLFLLLTPLASNTGPTRLPEAFGCLYNPSGTGLTAPRHPESCLRTVGR